MICENTISAGFYFMMGKFLFELALTISFLAIVVLFWLWVARSSKPAKKEKNTP